MMSMTDFAFVYFICLTKSGISVEFCVLFSKQKIFIIIDTVIQFSYVVLCLKTLSLSSPSSSAVTSGVEFPDLSSDPTALDEECSGDNCSRKFCRLLSSSLRSLEIVTSVTELIVLPVSIMSVLVSI